MIHCFEALQSDRKSFDLDQDLEQDRGMFLSPPGMKIISTGRDA